MGGRLGFKPLTAFRSWRRAESQPFVRGVVAQGQSIYRSRYESVHEFHRHGPVLGKIHGHLSGKLQGAWLESQDFVHYIRRTVHTPYLCKCTEYVLYIRRQHLQS